jgi:hypothetical protein
MQVMVLAILDSLNGLLSRIYVAKASAKGIGAANSKKQRSSKVEFWN